jgi:hypothetical protein
MLWRGSDGHSRIRLEMVDNSYHHHWFIQMITFINLQRKQDFWINEGAITWPYTRVQMHQDTY